MPTLLSAKSAPSRRRRCRQALPRRSAATSRTRRLLFFCSRSCSAAGRQRRVTGLRGAAASRRRRRVEERDGRESQMNTSVSTRATRMTAGRGDVDERAQVPHQKASNPHPCVRPRFIRPSNHHGSHFAVLRPSVKATSKKPPQPAYSGCSFAARARVRGSIQYMLSS